MTNTSLRQRILAFVGALVVLSLLGSVLSLYRITEVNRSLDAINRISIPLGRLLVRMKSDSAVLKREVDRGLGYRFWKDPSWRPRPLPRWVGDLLETEIEKARELVSDDSGWADQNVKNHWKDWLSKVSIGLNDIRNQSAQLYSLLEQRTAQPNEEEAMKIYPKWESGLEEWIQQLEWGVSESEHAIRQTFTQAENRVSQLRTGLQVILIVVVFLSGMLLWLGERALRPLENLTRLAREIARRGLKKEDKALFPEISLARSDEVSQLAHEFRNMATALLEREKTVEQQKSDLEEQNHVLKKMMTEQLELQKRLRIAENMAAVGRMSAQVAHEVRNPLHSIGLEAEMAYELSAKMGNIQLKQATQSILQSVERLEKITENYLKLSRPSSGEKKKIDLGEVLESVLATYAPQSEAQSVHVDWIHETGKYYFVVGDRDLLEQVLGNLMKNALQALAVSQNQVKRITWHLAHIESGKVWLRVEDTGPGVSPAIRDRLFSPFVTTKAEGTGLGLPFIKKVLEDHYGDVCLVNRKPGEGACFDVHLPAYIETQAEREVVAHV